MYLRISEKELNAATRMVSPLILDTHDVKARVGYMKMLADAYRGQYDSAKRRGVGWGFTYLEWVRVWVESGHLVERGVKGDGYVMSRFNDSGPYKPGNVEIIRSSENLAQPQVPKHRKGRKPATGCKPDHLKRGNHHKSKPVLCVTGKKFTSVRAAAAETDEYLCSDNYISRQCKMVTQIYGDDAEPTIVEMREAECRWRYLSSAEVLRFFPAVKASQKKPKKYKRENFGRSVVAPDGTVYKNAAQAAVSEGITRAGMTHRCRHEKSGWRYEELV